ncbi:MAG: hypothetical protein QNJ71_09540, partial [Acidimicrobiia bacterium]|nr:hypothetical protein [Acidimicrobiia bacterium]
DELPEDIDGKDILIIGNGDRAIELATRASGRARTVVIAAKGIDPGKLSPAAEDMLHRLERDRRATVFYRSTPASLSLFGDHPLAVFDDRRMPDLEFDEVVFASRGYQPRWVRRAIDAPAQASGLVISVARPDEGVEGPIAHGRDAATVVAEAVFPDLDIVTEPPPIELRSAHRRAVEELRNEYYNATITHFEPSHSDLWVLRVRPDQGGTSHTPGQYATLGLGYWEERVDEAIDPKLDERWDKLIRRSYSISHPVFDEHGYLAARTEGDEHEFYIVLVPPTARHIPALTPRIALKRPGDRIFLGSKVAGRYTLNPVTDPTATVVFLATGTGEAPHNSMIVELLRKGHEGPIISAVTARRWNDLGYLDEHRRLDRRFRNYHYLPFPTREADHPKRYVQDLVRDGDLEDAAGRALEPGSAHFFLCGNPAMIGIPEEVDGSEVFPEPVGVVELLTERGFTLDRRGAVGDLHVEEYW